MSVTRRHIGAVGLGFAAASCATWPRALRAATEADLSGPPNVFISPCGQPFRAAAGEAYPVAAWFKQADRKADGRLDKAEFIADAEAFFKILDRNGDGVLSPIEVAIYEQRIAPEILGARFTQGAAPAANRWAGLLRLAQVHGPGPIDPGGASSADDLPPTPRHLDESGEGASPFSFFDEPEPVMAADLSFAAWFPRPDSSAWRRSISPLWMPTTRAILPWKRSPRPPCSAPSNAPTANGASRRRYEGHQHPWRRTSRLGPDTQAPA